MFDSRGRRDGEHRESTGDIDSSERNSPMKPPILCDKWSFVLNVPDFQVNLRLLGTFTTVHCRFHHCS